MLSLQFQCAAAIYERIKALDLELSELDREAFELGEEISEMMVAANLTDADVARLADLAGEVMRSHRVTRDDTSGISMYDGDDGLPCLCSSVHLAVSYEEASDMNFELAELVANATPSLSPNRYIIRFVGRDEHNA
ncbi:hypothetical protein AT959_07800 [Dechloromonas denitrificans]|uniref:Uncharacterized protein n=2 Tax=Dechloromonas denitrificans TaxID=281362 RepID=A0A133XK36_9RHOO|nr:hypothetical protein AT959_07800 [Dechloromonas denitrificans]